MTERQAIIKRRGDGLEDEKNCHVHFSNLNITKGSKLITEDFAKSSD